MGQADMKSSADVVALEAERQKRAAEAEGHLSTAGGMLRAAREALGLSLRDVAARTNIKEQHLAAIEAMEVAALPSQPYTMGFVRAYAREVALPEDALMERFRQQAGYQRREVAEPMAPARRRGEEVEGGRELSVLALLAILAFVVWTAWKILMSSAPEEAVEGSRFSFSASDTAAPVVPAPETGDAGPAEPIMVTPAVPEADTRTPLDEAEAVEPGEPAGQPAESVAAPEEGGGEEMAADDPSATGEAAEATQATQATQATEAVALRRIVSVDPVYPPLCEASAAKVETVVLAFTVNGRGRPGSPRVVSSTNPCFNGAAIAALTRWRYDPESVTPETARGRATFTFDRPY